VPFPGKSAGQEWPIVYHTPGPRSNSVGTAGDTSFLFLLPARRAYITSGVY